MVVVADALLSADVEGGTVLVAAVEGSNTTSSKEARSEAARRMKAAQWWRWLLSFSFSFRLMILTFYNFLFYFIFEWPFFL